MNRRDFIKTGALAAAAAMTPDSLFAANPEEIKAVLLHLGHNMWCEWLPQDLQGTLDLGKSKPDAELRCKDEIWRDLTDYAAAKKLNMVMIDVGEGLVFPSHPELAIKGSWSPDKLRAEVRRLKAMGLEPIPKLNFSATHDGWLKDYHRMLTTPAYYAMQREVIRDVWEVFEHPRFFHLGFDEEAAGWIGKRNYFVIRQGELWWHDMLYAVKCVEDLGCRAWIWSDYGWHHPDFLTRCPKSVLLSDWYYDECLGGFDINNYVAKNNGHKERLQQFHDLEKAGFEQVPCGTNWIGGARRAKNIGADDVIGKLVKLGREVIAPERLKGFMMAPWAACDTEDNRALNRRGIDLFADALAGVIHEPGPCTPRS